jgi:hypothetical protein
VPDHLPAGVHRQVQSSCLLLASQGLVPGAHEPHSARTLLHPRICFTCFHLVIGGSSDPTTDRAHSER